MKRITFQEDLPMKKHLLLVILLISAMLLGSFAPAETVEPETPACGGCGSIEAIHDACELCNTYSCDPDYFAGKHRAICIGCGERFCGPYRQKGHVACPCGALSCAENFDPAAHAKCDCGVYACKDPLFEINHAACEGCGVQICDRAYGRHSHKLCSGCGMRKCDPEYKAEAHEKCNGCRELLCASEHDHTSCRRCRRYVCKASDKYYEHDHSLSWWGWPNCIEYKEEEEETPQPEPVTPPTEGCPGNCGNDSACEKLVCSQSSSSGCLVPTPTYKCQLNEQLWYCTHCDKYYCGSHIPNNCMLSTSCQPVH